MCQETLDICLDQVSHLCPGVDFSTITLKSRWDPKGRRIFVPQESDGGSLHGLQRLCRSSVQSLPFKLRSRRLEMRQVCDAFWHLVMPFDLRTLLIVLKFAYRDVLILRLSVLHNLFVCSSASGDQSGEVPWCLFRPLYRLPFGLILKP
ncbi:hypothetical protein PIB30_010298 [Stylosanthes scabra]|uniref:Uncharacterized protein n=1 Tax=Stylosanthes scabra TaxID=79078 RepID=A0ABU6U5M3_9FABA|nr:hypothetical protein [Stylosanthes scabra]